MDDIKSDIKVIDVPPIDIKDIDINLVLASAYLEYSDIVKRYPGLMSNIPSEKLIMAVDGAGKKFLLVRAYDLIPPDMREKLSKGKYSKLLKMLKAVL